MKNRILLFMLRGTLAPPITVMRQDEREDLQIHVSAADRGGVGPGTRVPNLSCFRTEGLTALMAVD